MRDNADLLATLKKLRADPAVAVQLYEQLFRGTYVALVQNPALPLDQVAFLTYPSRDVRELPVFTSSRRRLLSKLQRKNGSAQLALDGPSMWRRFIDVIETRDIVAAVDPGERYGIRVTREMILGMVREYGG